MVTIISAIYKSEHYLEGLIKHAKEFAAEMAKRHAPFEFIVVHTQSTPTELEILKTVESEPWCKIIRFDPLGVFGAWNTGVEAAGGDVIGFWNADDIRFPEAVIEAKQLADTGAEVIYFPFIIKRYINLGPLSFPVITRKIEGEILRFEKRYFETSYNGGPHFMFTKKAYEKVGPFDEQFRIAGDFDWFARAAHLDLKFALAKNYSGIFRVDGRGMSAGRNVKLQTENNIIFRRQNALEKLVPGLEDSMKSYTVDTISRGTNKIPFRYIN